MDGWESLLQVGQRLLIMWLCSELLCAGRTAEQDRVMLVDSKSKTSSDSMMKGRIMQVLAHLLYFLVSESSDMG